MVRALVTRPKIRCWPTELRVPCPRNVCRVSVSTAFVATQRAARHAMRARRQKKATERMGHAEPSPIRKTLTGSVPGATAMVQARACISMASHAAPHRNAFRPIVSMAIAVEMRAPAHAWRAPRPNEVAASMDNVASLPMAPIPTTNARPDHAMALARARSFPRADFPRAVRASQAVNAKAAFATIWYANRRNLPMGPSCG